MTLKLIGAGFGRTGTLSLKNAIEILGLGRCYHMMEVMQNPGHSELWNQVADGEYRDWDTLFEGYDAVVDWPACNWWRELSAHYPDAKILLSVRDPERWYESVMNTIYQVISKAESMQVPALRAQFTMAKKIVFTQTFDDRIEDREYAIGVYERHIETVRSEVPAERLLVYEVGEGWEALCRFLGCPIPDEAFPRVNSTEEFQGMTSRLEGAS